MDQLQLLTLPNESDDDTQHVVSTSRLLRKSEKCWSYSKRKKENYF